MPKTNRDSLIEYVFDHTILCNKFMKICSSQSQAIKITSIETSESLKTGT